MHRYEKIGNALNVCETQEVSNLITYDFVEKKIRDAKADLEKYEAILKECVDLGVESEAALKKAFEEAEQIRLKEEEQARLEAEAKIEEEVKG